MIKDVTWMMRLMAMCELIATWSKDPSTKVGAVIVDKHKRILSTGYNGFPKGVEDTPDRYEDREIKYRMIRHAEANAVSFAKESLEGATIASMFYPCAQCAGAIIQAGIKQVITYQPTDDYMSRWSKEVEVASTMFNEAGVEVYLLEKK